MLTVFDAGDGRERQLEIFRRKLVPMLKQIGSDEEITIDDNQLCIGIVSLGDYHLICNFELVGRTLYYECAGERLCVDFPVK